VGEKLYEAEQSLKKKSLFTKKQTDRGKSRKRGTPVSGGEGVRGDEDRSPSNAIRTKKDSVKGN